jgi:mono/diheme cytochrome c family protein
MKTESPVQKTTEPVCPHISPISRFSLSNDFKALQRNSNQSKNLRIFPLSLIRSQLDPTGVNGTRKKSAEWNSVGLAKTTSNVLPNEFVHAFIKLMRFPIARVIFCLLLALPPARAATPAKRLDFNRDIRPILSDNCFSCHGFDEKKRKAKLRLDTFEGATAVRDEKPAIKPKDLAGSELWSRITTTNADDHMPPADSNKKLTEAQIATLKQWILEGAEYKGHWAFQAPVKPELPAIKNKKWPKNEIDYFIAQKLEEKNLKPEPEASKERLIRRVTFDLTGLPPTPAEVDAFLKDKRPEAYEAVVDRLLQSPHYGEHQARYWLDAVRYGDTHGLHLDNERSMWPYRDWVVKAFNENMPYDQFATWQLAGDLLPNATLEQKTASGYNRCNVTTSEGGAIDEEFYVRYAVDRTETTAINFMALTAGCAVCHDHKYDPISQKEFYSMYAFFNNCTEKAMDGNAMDTPPAIKLPTVEQQKQLADIDKKMASLKKKISEELSTVKYKDPGPSTLPTTTNAQEYVFLDDEIPVGSTASKEDPALQWVTNNVFSGKRAIKRTGTAVTQDFFLGSTQPMIVTKGDKLFAYVYLDPAHPPKSIMLQFHTTDWNFRANWGDEDAIPFGDKGTPKKKQMGKLPELGKWVKLEFDIIDLKMKSGLRINGVALTQFGGTVYWDKVGIVSKAVQKDLSPVSLKQWEMHVRAEDVVGLPEDVTKAIMPRKGTKPTEKELKALKEYYLSEIHDGTREQFKTMRAKLEPMEKERKEISDKIPLTLVFQEMDKPRGAFVLKRGEYDKRGDAVQPGTPKFLPPLPQSDVTNRLTFAKWLTATNHPLTSRVIVNRYWQQFFGTGIVKTAQDFGSQGEWPSHPELLDWLATHFMGTGWNVKNMHRLIVTSAAYRQDSHVTPKKLEVDPENRLVSRGPRFRLDAEEIRDNALYVSGLLVDKPGGHADKSYQPGGIWEAVGYTASNTAKYQQDHGDALYRRSLYLFWKRTAPPPTMITFDAPSREKYCVRRERSDTPLQALVTMNDVQYVEAARHLAQRLLNEQKDPASRIDYGFRLVTSRHPNAEEKSTLRDLLEKNLSRYRNDKAAAQKLITQGESLVDKKADPADLAAYTMVSSVLLNLDETLNKN